MAALPINSQKNICLQKVDKRCCSLDEHKAGGMGFLFGKMVGVLVIFFRVLNSNFLISLRGFFASSLKPIMIFFRVPNFHDVIKR